VIGSLELLGAARMGSKERIMRPARLTVCLAFILSPQVHAADDGPMHSSGRPLPKMPPIKKPILFNTPEADRILEALQVFPADNAFNVDISKWPVHPNSKKIIASIGADKPFRYNPDMGFVLVPPNQKKIAVKLTGYSEESDKGRYLTICPSRAGLRPSRARS